MIKNIINGEEISKLIFIVATGRSGSNMLVELINSIDNVFMRMEPDIANIQVEGKEALTAIETALHTERHIPTNKKDYNVTGCKFLDTHVWLCNLNEEVLKSYPYDVKIIHLYRKNILDQFLSLKLAEKNNKWISVSHKDGTYDDYDITVDLKEFQKYEDHKKRKYQEYLSKFPNAYIVDYESLSEDPQTFFDSGLFQYLEVEPCPIMFKTKKQSKKTKNDIITNIDEIKSYINIYL